MHSRVLGFVLIWAILGINCQQKHQQQGPIGSPHYNFDSALATIDFTSELKELSGIAYLNQDTLLAIDNEVKGFYFVSISTGKTAFREITEKGSDYEDIALAGDKIYILQSNATLLEVSLKQAFQEGPQRVIAHKNRMKGVDAEGLVYDSSSKQLLVAFKKHDDEKKSKLIFTFDPITGKYSNAPLLTVNLEELKEDLFSTRFEKFSLKVNQLIHNDRDLFEPSAIGLHPHSGELYVLSAKNSLLAVYTKSGILSGIYTLPLKKFAQAEGICFDPAGNVYISNEARVGPANILKFQYHD